MYVFPDPDRQGGLTGRKIKRKTEKNKMKSVASLLFNGKPKVSLTRCIGCNRVYAYCLLTGTWRSGLLYAKRRLEDRVVMCAVCGTKLFY